MSGSTAPLFTVVVPLFNKAAYIAATLASISTQTFEDYEVIVVDDGSTDDGGARVMAAGGGVRLIDQPNAGPGSARNRAIAEARGEWIAFIDADDLWRPGHLATLVRTMRACPDADVVATGFERGETLSPTTARTGGDPHYIDFFRDYPLIWTSAAAVRTSSMQTQRFGPAWPGEDVDLWIRLALRHRFAVHPARTALYVQRTGGAMDSQGSAAAPVPIARQPVFTTLADALADPALADRHADLAALRNRLLIDYTRPALFNGRMPLARSYIAELRRGGGRPFPGHVLLAIFPGSVLRLGARFYGRAKRLLHRSAGGPRAPADGVRGS